MSNALSDFAFFQNCSNQLHNLFKLRPLLSGIYKEDDANASSYRYPLVITISP
jgi:hypothetical protein